MSTTRWELWDMGKKNGPVESGLLGPDLKFDPPKPIERGQFLLIHFEDGATGAFGPVDVGEVMALMDRINPPFDPAL